MKKTIILFLFVFHLIAGRAQTSKIDSLLNVVSHSTSDTIVLKAYYDIANILFEQDPDSSMYFWRMAISYIDRQEKHQKNEIDKLFLSFFKSIFQNEMAYYQMHIGNAEESMQLLKKAEQTLRMLLLESKFPEPIQIKYHLGQNYNLQAGLYRDQGNIAKALEYNHKSLKLREETDDQEGIAQTLNNLGLIHKNLKEYENALKYYERSLEIIKNNPKMRYEAGYCLLNIASLYRDKENLDKAEILYNMALSYFEEFGVKSGIAFIYYNLAILRKLKNQKAEALEYFQKSLKIRQQINDRKSIVNTLAEIGMIYLDYGKMGKASKIARQAHAMSMELGFPEQIEKTARLLKKIEFQQGNYKDAYEYQRIEFTMRDSVFNLQIKNESEKQYLRYEFEKKAAIDSIEHSKELEIMNLELAKGEAVKDRQRIVIYSLIFSFIFIIVFLVVVYRMYLQKKQANQLLQLQNREILQQKEEILAQRDEIESQRNKLFEQNELLDRQKQNITDSIEYARQIQNAILPEKQTLDDALGSYFIIFKPKDIVSGDFYWVGQNNHKTIVAIADCTGHGVPGAFMSMLGISFLNEIVGNLGIVKPEEILSELRNLIINALKQNEKFGRQKDGIDISVLCIDSEEKTYHWAGANNHLYIVRKGKSNDNAGEMKHIRISQFESYHVIEVRGDSMPASYFVKMDNFISHRLDVQSGDRLYMMTDGFADQTGGANEKKIMTSGLKQVLTNTAHLPISDQKEALLSELESWMNYGDKAYEQIDDITILGFQI
ncbi:MAG TPA: tetratricopeptide repeat protein [Salinivirgaceae bacterium]|nr:tetratricopeptide repeat protein [Salinivirgaceae bacterium]